jgi:hypothetical protein
MDFLRNHQSKEFYDLPGLLSRKKAREKNPEDRSLPFGKILVSPPRAPRTQRKALGRKKKGDGKSSLAPVKVSSPET